MKTKQIRLDKSLRKYLKENNTNQNQLSRKIGIGPSSLHSYINGIIPRGLVTLVNMAHELNLSLDELVFSEYVTSKGIEVRESRELIGKYEIIIKKAM